MRAGARDADAHLYASDAALFSQALPPGADLWASDAALREGVARELLWKMFSPTPFNVACAHNASFAHLGTSLELRAALSGVDADWHYCELSGRVFASAGWSGEATLNW